MTFKEYLTQKYIESKHPLDDDMADGFDEWYTEQDPDQIIAYAEEWDSLVRRKAVEECLNIVKDGMREMNNISLNDCAFYGITREAIVKLESLNQLPKENK